MGGEIVSVFAILLIVGGAVAYIIKAKKSGQKCIGCPNSKTCSGNCSCSDFSSTTNGENK